MCDTNLRHAVKTNLATPSGPGYEVFSQARHDLTSSPAQEISSSIEERGSSVARRIIGVDIVSAANFWSLEGGRLRLFR